MKFFVGLDVSLMETAICLVDADEIIIAEAKTASEPDEMFQSVALDWRSVACRGGSASSSRRAVGRRYASIRASCADSPRPCRSRQAITMRAPSRR